MDKHRTNVNRNRAPGPPRRNERIYFHTPAGRAAAFPYHVLAAGDTHAEAEEAPIRRRFNQHVLILTLEGNGRIETDGKTCWPSPGSLAWLDTSRRYGHACDRGPEGWHYLWIGLRGFGLDDIRAAAFASDPVMVLAESTPIHGLFVEIIGRLAAPQGDIDAPNSAAVAQVIARLLGDREAGTDVSGDAPIGGLMARIRADIVHPWRIGELAALVGLSPAQFHRRFHAAAGTTPMEWVRRERINAAKPRLTDSIEKIAAVAMSCGYSDPYHFSRDFKRLTGVSPVRFRREGGL